MPARYVPLSAGGVPGPGRYEPVQTPAFSGSPAPSPDPTNLALGATRTAAGLGGTAARALDLGNVASSLDLLGHGLGLAGQITRDGPVPGRVLGGAGNVVGAVGTVSRIPAIRDAVPGLAAAGQPIPSFSVPATVVPPAYDLSGPVGSASTVAGGTNVTPLSVAGGALQVGSGILTLTQGGNNDIPGQEGWEGRGGAQIVGGAMTAAGIPVLGAIISAAMIGDSIFQRPGNERWMRNIREQAGNIGTAGQSFGALEDAVRSGDLTRDVGGVRAGDLLLGIVEGNLRGDFGAAFGWEPNPAYSAGSAWLRQRGFTPASYDRGGVHGNAGFVSNLGTFDPHSSTAQGEHGVSRFRSLVDPYAERLNQDPGLSAAGLPPASRPEFLSRVADEVLRGTYGSDVLPGSRDQVLADLIDDGYEGRSEATDRVRRWLREHATSAYPGGLPRSARSFYDPTAGE